MPIDSVGTQASAATVVGEFDIISAQRIVLSNMTIRDSAEIGVTLANGAAAVLDTVTVTGHPVAGVAATSHSFLLIRGTSVIGTATNDSAVLASEGSTLRIRDSSFTSPRNARFAGAALSLYRMSNARIDENTTLSNTNVSAVPEEALAVFTSDMTNLRIQRAGTSVIGNVAVGEASAADLRNVTVVGQLRLESKSHLTLSLGAGVQGDVHVYKRSLFEAYGGAGSVSGTVRCYGESAASGAAAASMSLQGCSYLTTP